MLISMSKSYGEYMLYPFHTLVRGQSPVKERL